jgi:hypothetical protein
MSSTEQIRESFTDDQKDALSIIWDYFLSEGEWIPLRALHKQFGGKAEARAILDRLGGSIVSILGRPDLDRYQLTLLGILLTSNGEGYEQLLARYLRFVKEKSYEEPKRTDVSCEEVAQALRLNSQEVTILGHLVRYDWLSSGGSFGKDHWTAGIPRNIEDIPDDVLLYLQQTVGERFDPNVPLDPAKRRSYHPSKTPGQPSGPFAFISNIELRTQLESDWQEANNVHQTQAWKSCVVLCGGILEGMLIDALQTRKEEASRSYKKLKQKETAPNISRWSLQDMVDVAQDIGILGKGSFHLSHAIRQYRNLIHPAKQVAEGIEITEDSANIAISSIRTFIREFEHTYGRANA